MCDIIKSGQNNLERDVETLKGRRFTTVKVKSKTKLMEKNMKTYVITVVCGMSYLREVVRDNNEGKVARAMAAKYAVKYGVDNVTLRRVK